MLLKKFSATNLESHEKIPLKHILASPSLLSSKHCKKLPTTGQELQF